MFGMLNQNIHRTFWLKHPLYPSFAQIKQIEHLFTCHEWEAISETLIKEGDEAAGFLVLHDKPTEELNEELKGKMTDLQETIKRLSEPGLSGHTDEPNIDMETKEGEPSEDVDMTPKETETPQGGLGFASGESSSYPEAEQVPVAPKAEGSGTKALCVRRSSRLFSRRLQQAGGLPGVLPGHPRLFVNMLQSCTEAELADLFSRFMHPPLSEAVARQDSATKRQSGPWVLAWTLQGWTRLFIIEGEAAGNAALRVDVQRLHGWLAGSTTPSFLCPKGSKVPYEAPSASYTMDGTVWNLVPLDGKPTCVQSPDSAEGAGGRESNKEASSKYSKSIDATQLAQALVATSWSPSRRACTPWQIVRSTVKAPLL